ncbi:hypothetical protein TYRP_013538 [Tyrophagus putrescentiae]|nr:hypothetical protein TYRP_013538 [Tyrophagus putrescentiae]
MPRPCIFLLTSVKFAEPDRANRAMRHRLAIKEMHCFNVNLAATSDGHIESDSGTVAHTCADSARIECSTNSIWPDRVPTSAESD